MEYFLQSTDSKFKNRILNSNCIFQGQEGGREIMKNKHKLKVYPLEMYTTGVFRKYTSGQIERVLGDYVKC